MDESKPGPLDGIIEETAAKPQAASEDTESRPRIMHPNENGRTSVQEDTVRKLRNYPDPTVRDADVAVLARKVQTLEAMIFALRGVVGAAALASVFALFQTRKLQKRVSELEGSSKKKVIEVEAKTVTPVPVSSGGPEAPVVD